jgi:lipopolysaccharide biosynthesis glycosyltransferase
MNFCVCFDTNYLHKGLCCLYTLLKNDPDTKIFVLCFDDYVYNRIEKIKNVVPIKIFDVEKQFSELLSIKNSRQPKEYYATTSPILPLYIFNNYSYVDKLFYTDADIVFWANQNEILGVFGEKSIMVVDQEFEPPRMGIRFNVGILGYKNDSYCKDFLDWWKDRCIEWCYWITTPDGKLADQGYLNILYEQPDKFKNTLFCPHPGINMGPWNISKHKITENNGKPIVDDKYNLICYHYHEFKMVGNSYYPTGWKYTESDKKIVYEPYFELMKKSIMGQLL